jgi:hypothetical protein
MLPDVLSLLCVLATEPRRVFTKLLTRRQLGPDERLSAADASERRVEQGLLRQPGGLEGLRVLGE